MRIGVVTASAAAEANAGGRAVFMSLIVSMGISLAIEK